MRTAYDKVFAGEAAPEGRIEAQKPKDFATKGKSEHAGLREKVLNAILEGKLSLDAVGKIGNLLAKSDGTKKPQDEAVFEGYV